MMRLIILSLLFQASGMVIANQPNVLFIICDDLNTHVSTSDYKHIQTPAFDRLARTSVNFQRAYCQYPVCGPSRASFLSGMYPQSTGIISNKTDIRTVRPGTHAMPEVFKSAGYWTGGVGKVFHNQKTNPEEVWDEFHFFSNDELPMVREARLAFEKKYGVKSLDGTIRGKHRKAWLSQLSTLGTQIHNKQTPGYGPSGLSDKQHKDGKNAEQVTKWLKERPFGDQPFFIACGIHKPHAPFLAPQKYFDMYPREQLVYQPANPNFWQQAPQIAQTKRYKGFGFEMGKENHDLRRKYMQAYHACVSFIDAQINQILDTLEASGGMANTIVILTSDHGYLLGEKYLWGKVFLFENCTRVPLLIHVPESAGISNLPRGVKSQALVELIDLFPTLTDLCRIKTSEKLMNQLQGQSMVPLIKNPKRTLRQTAYTVVNRFGELGKSICNDTFRYTRWPEGESLYKINDDVNLIHSPEYQKIAQDLKERLKEVNAQAQRLKP